MHPGHILGQARRPQLHHKEARGHNAKRLAHHQAEERTEQRRVREQGAQVAARKPDVRVREREQGQDREVHPGVEQMLQTRRRRHDLLRHARQRGDRLQVILLPDNGFLRVEGALRLDDALARPADEALHVHARAGGDRKREQHASDGRVHARHEHAVPQHGPRQQIRIQREHVALVHEQQRAEDDRRAAKPRQRRRLPVEHRDDDDCDDVVGDGQGAQEHAHPVRHAIAEKRQDSQRERDIGRRRDAPAARRVEVAHVERGVDGHGHEHAAHRSDDGKNRLADVRQLAHRHLVFDLQAHKQEEHRHKHVVDHVRERHRRLRLPEHEADVGVPEMGEGVGDGRVRHRKRRDRREEHRTRRLRGRARELDELAIAGLMALNLADVDAPWIGVLRAGVLGCCRRIESHAFRRARFFVRR